MITEIPKTPRWNKAYKMSREFIKSEKITELPVEVFDIYAKRNWLIISAKDAHDIFSDYLWNDFYCNEIDAITFKKRNIYITIYNERFPYERIRWTIAHEIGHIVLRHLDDFEETCVYRSGLNEEKYGVLEQEAHTFAAGLLAPSALLMLCNTYDKKSIQKICNISKEAAEKCENTIKKRRKLFINESEVSFYKLQFKKFLSQKSCIICGYYTPKSLAKYCAICGNKTLVWDKGENAMLYENAIIDECHICENEEIDTNARFCKICGTFILNKCSSPECGINADANARFCIKCGKPTEFQKRDFLQNWQKEKEELQFFPNEEIPF